MPMHDWTRVDAGIYHAFHHAWIEEIHRALLSRLPADFYSLPEQHAAGYGPDILTLSIADDEEPAAEGGLLVKTAPLTKPKTTLYETAGDFYASKQKSVAIRHVSGDRIVAIVEIVSPGNKDSQAGVQAFVRKARELLRAKIHLLIIDPFPVNVRVPHGLHAAIFSEFRDEPLRLPPESPLSLFAYECGQELQAYLEPLAVGDRLPDMPVFLFPDYYVQVPLESTYEAAWQAVPARWQKVIAPPAAT